MSEPSFEEISKKVTLMETKLKTYEADVAKKAEEDEKKDPEMEASFKKAMEDMDNKDKEHSAETDDMEKVKDAFKKAQDETDPEKKEKAMKKAIDEKEDYEQKHSKKGETDSPKEDKKEMEAKIAAIVMKKVPLMNKILEATKIIDPTNYIKVEKELTAATLEEVEAKFETIKPYVAAIGLQNSNSQQKQIGVIPFQANIATGEINKDNVLEGSVEDIDFSKVSTKDLMEMYR